MITPIPTGINFTQENGQLTITRRWFSPMIIFLLFFTILWDGFLFFFYKMMFWGGMSTFVALFPILHVAVGVGLTYSVLTGFLNKTIITVYMDELTIKHRPLPWRGNRTLHRNDILQLYCEEVSHRNSHRHSSSYRMNAVLSNQRKLVLLTGISDRSQVIYFEKEIEKFMGIQDVPVAGEMR